MKNKLWLLFIMMIIAVNIFVVKETSSMEKAESNQDLHVLLNSTDGWINNKKVMIKYGDFYTSSLGSSKLDVLGDDLAQHFNLPFGFVEEASSDKYQTTLNLEKDNIMITLSLTAMEEHSTHYVMLTIEGNASSTLSILEEWKERVERNLRSLGIHDEANIIIDGFLTPDANADGGGHQKWWSAITASLQLQEVERYQERGTLSVSFYSSMLSNTITSGSQPMNMQIALHQESHTNLWRVTAGTPIITID